MRFVAERTIGLLGAAAVTLAASCARYETRPVRASECPPDPAPAVAFVASSRLAESAPYGAVRGIAVAAESGAAVDHVEILLKGSGSPEVIGRAMADGTGRFDLDSLTAGTYFLEARRIGFAVRRDVIEVSTGTELQLVLPLRPMVHDGCPGFMAVRLRKPWWKW